jgi:hypothetical protein
VLWRSGLPVSEVTVCKGSGRREGLAGCAVGKLVRTISAFAPHLVTFIGGCRARHVSSGYRLFVPPENGRVLDGRQ